MEVDNAEVENKPTMENKPVVQNNSKQIENEQNEQGLKSKSPRRIQLTHLSSPRTVSPRRVQLTTLSSPSTENVNEQSNTEAKVDKQLTPGKEPRRIAFTTLSKAE